MNTEAIEKLKTYALEALGKMSDPRGPKQKAMHIVVTRDEGGYMMHEIINPLDVSVEDWRFHEEDADIVWDPQVLKDENGFEALSICRILC